MTKNILICGAGGFIGHHLVKRLKNEGFWVRGVDLKYPEFEPSLADEFIIGDLRDPKVCKDVIYKNGFPIDEIYQLAADMGGAAYVFSGTHDADIMHNSALINLNMAAVSAQNNIKKIFYSSSACIYPAYNQNDPDNPKCAEESAYPAAPDSEYGWEKLFSERLYLSYHRNYNLQVRIARFHNIFGPLGTWHGGREKAPAAISRKIAESQDGVIEIWGDGKQTRSFLYIDDCIDAIRLLMDSDFLGPINIGSEEMVTINQLVEITSTVAKKTIKIKHIEGPTGVRGRNSDNKLIRKILGWNPKYSLAHGIEITYPWIVSQLQKSMV